jgi:hypothetical protein
MLAGFLLVRFLRASADRERSVEFRPDPAAWNDNDRRSSRPRRRSGKRAESGENA